MQRVDASINLFRELRAKGGGEGNWPKLPFRHISLKDFHRFSRLYACEYWLIVASFHRKPHVVPVFRSGVTGQKGCPETVKNLLFRVICPKDLNRFS